MAAPLEQTGGAFAIGEKVAVPHTDKQYEAKVLKAELRADGIWYYYLHYSGWNKKYDEWVEEHGLIRCPQGDTAVPAAGAGMAGPPRKKLIRDKQLGLALLKQRRLDVPSGQAASQAAGSAPGAVAANEAGAMLAEALEIPPLLKKQLLADYDAIMEEGKLIPLPRNPTAEEVLKRYVAESKVHRGSSDNEEELAHGLRSYLDKALHTVLLYRPERGQESAVLGDGRVASSVYGAEHLLRLCTKLPDLLSITQVTEDQAQSVAVMVQDFLYWMSDNADSLFLSKEQYVDAEEGGKQ